MLVEDQRYVIERARECGVDLALVEHGRQTSSCEEKAALLGWPLERIVKTLYVGDGRSTVGIVAPANLCPVPVARLLKASLGLGTRAAKRYLLSQPPQGMAYGTCTPFAHKRLVGDQIDLLILVGEPSLCTGVIDVAIGGVDDAARRRSAQLPYEGLARILEAEFGAYVKRAPMLRAA